MNCFLLNLVRQDLDEGAQSIPLAQPEIICVGALGRTMIVRAYIEQEMTLADTFKPVLFAT